MPIIKLNERIVATLKPGTVRQEYTDAMLPGFTLRITPKGVRTFAFLYRTPTGKFTRLTIGRFPDIGLAKARDKARQALRALEVGHDPSADLKQARTQTFSALGRAYIEKHAKPRKRTWRADQSMIAAELEKTWGPRPAASIRRSDVRALLDGIVARGAGTAANRVLSLVRKMFNFALDREWIEVNPAARMAKPKKERARDRVLTDAELKATWAWLHTPAPKKATGLVRRHHQLNRGALALRLITAQRGNEVIGMAWSEVDGAWWTIPGSRTKNGLAHRVPLTALAKRELKALSAIIPAKQDAIFVGVRGTRQRHGALVGLGIPDIVPHDFRRTAASRMAAAGVPRLVIAKVLNHVETGVTAVYDRHSYDAEKRAALEQWAMLLMGLNRRRSLSGA